MLAGSVAQREWPQYEGSGKKACSYTGSLKRGITKLALEDYVNAQISSAIPSNVSELNNDVGYITASAIADKRDIDDLNVYEDPLSSNETVFKFVAEAHHVPGTMTEGTMVRDTSESTPTWKW